MSDGNEDYYRNRISHGNKFPYDAKDSWWRGGKRSEISPIDWAHSAARGILADLQDRRGIKWQFDGLDEDIREEIVETISGIIRLASKEIDQ